MSKTITETVKRHRCSVCTCMYKSKKKAEKCYDKHQDDLRKYPPAKIGDEFVFWEDLGEGYTRLCGGTVVKMKEKTTKFYGGSIEVMEWYLVEHSGGERTWLSRRARFTANSTSSFCREQYKQYKMHK